MSGSANAQASLMVRGGPNAGSTIPLSVGPNTLGRRSDNDVVVDESTVSRRHALIMETAAGYILRDLNTSNGTFVNRKKIGQGEHVLRHGDRIRLAGSDVTFIFRQDGAGTVQMSRDEPPQTGSMDLAELRDREQLEEEPETSLIGKDPELLTLLEANRATVVSREEIARQVWPELLEAGLADQVIGQSIARLRAHLGDDPSKPTQLITVGEHGFLLL